MDIGILTDRRQNVNIAVPESNWTVTVHTSPSREVFSYVFARKSRELQRETAVFPFLCIAERVTGHGANSNTGR